MGTSYRPGCVRPRDQNKPRPDVVFAGPQALPVAEDPCNGGMANGVNTLKPCSDVLGNILMGTWWIRWSNKKDAELDGGIAIQCAGISRSILKFSLNLGKLTLCMTSRIRPHMFGLDVKIILFFTCDP